jgi:hypothetical protein
MNARSQIFFNRIRWEESSCLSSSDSPEHIRLCSIPMCIFSLNYEFESKKISLSTFLCIFGNNNTSITDNINTIMIDFKKFVPTEYAPKVTINVNLWTVFYKSHFLLLFIERFRTTSKLDWLHFNNYRSETIRLIKVTVQVIHEANSDMIVDITNLLRKTCNVPLSTYVSIFTQENLVW